MNVKYFFSLFFFLLLLFPLRKSYACGTATLTGPSYCEDGEDSPTPTRYEGTYISDCTGCESHTYTVTGGVFVDAQNQPIILTPGSSPTKYFLSECVIETPWQGPTSHVYVRWDPNAPVQELKFKGDGGALKDKDTGIPIVKCKDEAKILYKKVIAPNGFTVNSETCTSVNLTAQVEENACRQPNGFNWYVNGNLVGFTQSPTRNINITPSTQGTQIAVTAVYGNSESNAASGTFGAFVPGSIEGSDVLTPNSGSELYQVLGTSGIVTQWTVSSPNNNASIAAIGPNSAELSVINFFDQTLITIGAKVEDDCDNSKWLYKSVLMCDDPQSPLCFIITMPPQGDTPQNHSSHLPATSSLDRSENNVIDDINPEATINDESNGVAHRIGQPFNEYSTIVAYPNPVAQGKELILEQLPEWHEVSVINVYGQVLQTFVNTGYQVRLPTQKLNAGLYFIRVLDMESQQQVDVIQFLVQ